MQSTTVIRRSNPERLSADYLELEIIPHLPPVESVVSRLEQVADNHSLISDSITGKPYEVILYNPQATGDRLVELASYNSGPANFGNLFESALLAAMMPDKQVLYVASSAVGGTAGLESKEAEYLAATGRWIDEDGASLPFVQSMARALRAGDYEANGIVGNSAGGAVGFALGSALDPGQLDRIVAIDRPNWRSFLGRLSLAPKFIVGEGVILRGRHKKHSDDPFMIGGKIFDKLIEQFRSSGTAGQFVTTKNPQKSKQKRLYEPRAYTKGHKHGDPAVADAVHLMRRHPDAGLRFIQPSDSMFAIPGQSMGRYVLDKILKASPEADVVTLEIPGSHTSKEAKPSLNAQLVKYLLNTQT